MSDAARSELSGPLGPAGRECGGLIRSARKPSKEWDSRNPRSKKENATACSEGKSRQGE